MPTPKMKRNPKMKTTPKVKTTQKKRGPKELILLNIATWLFTASKYQLKRMRTDTKGETDQKGRGGYIGASLNLLFE